MKIGALILAAGAATRMGKIKQLLPYQGRTLLEHAIEQAQQAGFDPVVTVIGAEAETIRAVLDHTSTQWVLNENWQAGMGSSIATGMGHLPELDAVAILLADQPHVTTADLVGMRQAFENEPERILAARYSGTLGVPAFFVKSWFSRLAGLAPEAGARALLRDSENVAAYELPGAATDVDTPADYAALGLGRSIAEGDG